MLVGGDVARPGWPRARLGGEVAAREEAKWRRQVAGLGSVGAESEEEGLGGRGRARRCPKMD